MLNNERTEQFIRGSLSDSRRERENYPQQISEMDRESLLAVASRGFFYFLNHSSSKLILVEVLNSS